VASLGLALGLVGWRLARGQRPLHALAGLAGSLFSVGLALVTQSAAGYFLPGILSASTTGVAMVASIIVRRPLIALVGRALYGWPMGWLLHPRVRPAYSEITWAWAALYLVRGGVEATLASAGALGALAVSRVVTGWPAFALLVLVTYAYVPWRLDELSGPSVDEFRRGVGPGRPNRVDRPAAARRLRSPRWRGRPGG
jgi:hypothetical protein